MAEPGPLDVYATACLAGRVREKPELKDTREGYCEVELAIGPQRFTTIWRGDEARRMAGQVAPGSLVEVDGRLQQETWNTTYDGRRARTVIAGRRFLVLRGPDDAGEDAG